MANKRLSVIIMIFVITLITIFPLLAKDKAYIGIYPRDITEKDIEKNELKEHYGVYITKIVNDSPAEEAGLKKHDIIQKIDGEKVYADDQLGKMLNILKPDQKISLDIVRNKKKKTIKLTLGKKEIPGYKTRAYMGVYLSDLSDYSRKRYKLDKPYGIIIDEVSEDTPAEEAGLKDKDIILSLNGEKIYTDNQITQMLKILNPGEKGALEIFRDGKIMKIQIEFGEKSYFTKNTWNYSSKPDNFFILEDLQSEKKWIGIEMLSLNDQLLESYGLSNGVMIQKVEEDSPAEKGGLKAGDIVIKVDDKDIEKFKDIQRIIKKKEEGDEISVKVLRDKKEKVLKIKIGMKEPVGFEHFNIFNDGNSVKVRVDDNEDVVVDIENSLEGLDFNLDGLEAGLEILEESLEDIEIDINIDENVGSL